MRKNILAPSILSADFKELGSQIRETDRAGAEYIHFDVMDGLFVPSISFGMPVLSSIKGLTGQVMDVHLMVTEPVRYVEEFAKCGADIITVHLEACEDLKGTLDAIHRAGVKAGVTIRPGTPVSALEPYLDQAEMFLIMSVEPGFGGQAFIPESLDRIRKLRAMLDAKGLDTDIEVDGGIYHSNVGEVLEAGANVIVSGSGGMLEEEFVLPVLKSEETEFIIAVDKGLEFLYRHEIRPDYIVGDFDSVPHELVDYYREKMNVPVREFNPVKDASDTEIALRLCLGLNRKQIWILGGTGNRIDHLWANVQCLQIALDAGADARILDSHNQIRLLGGDITLRREEAFGPYFSLFPLEAPVDELTITGAKYPLKNHFLKPDDSLCVSNEFAEDEVKISFVYGKVILMETRD